jgi:hypothetical protein
MSRWKKKVRGHAGRSHGPLPQVWFEQMQGFTHSAERSKDGEKKMQCTIEYLGGMISDVGMHLSEYFPLNFNVCYSNAKKPAKCLS